MEDMELYQMLTEMFSKEMIEQLAGNARKGNREGWLSQEPMQLVIEIYYHTGKLQQAVKENNFELIREYSADVANIAMMVLDRCGGLLPPPNQFSEIKPPQTEWTNNIVKDNNEI